MIQFVPLEQARGPHFFLCNCRMLFAETPVLHGKWLVWMPVPVKVEKLKLPERRAMKFRVVYGEKRPVWEQEFSTKKAALAFVERCIDRGDMVFYVGEATVLAPRGLTHQDEE